MNSPELLDNIRSCASEDSVESLLKDFSASDKVSALKEAMGNPIVFFNKGEISLERQYKALIGSLLSGVWRDDYSSYEAMRRKASLRER
jgi:hypothetical protein